MTAAMKIEMFVLISVYFIGHQLFVDGCTQSGWSGWINDNKPITGIDGGEQETMNLSQKNRFCPFTNGKLTAIDCTSENGVQYNKMGLGSSGLSCRVDRGLRCQNKLLSPNRCVDFRIRLFCNCTNPVTTSTIPVTRRTRNSGTTRDVIGHMTPTPANGGQGRTSSGQAGSPGRGGGGQSGAGNTSGGQSGTNTSRSNGNNAASTSSFSWIATFLPAVVVCVTSLYVNSDVNV